MPPPLCTCSPDSARVRVSKETRAHRFSCCFHGSTCSRSSRIYQPSLNVTHRMLVALLPVHTSQGSMMCVWQEDSHTSRVQMDASFLQSQRGSFTHLRRLKRSKQCTNIAASAQLSENQQYSVSDNSSLSNVPPAGKLSCDRAIYEMN